MAQKPRNAFGEWVIEFCKSRDTNLTCLCTFAGFNRSGILNYFYESAHMDGMINKLKVLRVSWPMTDAEYNEAYQAILKSATRVKLRIPEDLSLAKRKRILSLIGDIQDEINNTDNSLNGYSLIHDGKSDISSGI